MTDCMFVKESIMEEEELNTRKVYHPIRKEMGERCETQK